jgi:hypothetical protein
VTELAVPERRLALMLFAALGQRQRPVDELRMAFEELWTAAPIREELQQLLLLQDDRRRMRAVPLAGTELPLASHATYGLYEVIAAMGLVGSKGKLREVREGVLFVESERTDVFFVTFEKSDEEFAPTTLYKDYPISPRLFHWESQNDTSETSPTGQRYVNHMARGTRILLFVRERKKDGRRETQPYTSLGYARYIRHERERPMAITWELERTMPGWLFQAGKVAAA